MIEITIHMKNEGGQGQGIGKEGGDISVRAFKSHMELYILLLWNICHQKISTNLTRFDQTFSILAQLKVKKKDYLHKKITS